MAEKKIADGTVAADETEFESDTTGNEPLQGIRHVMQEQMQAAGDGVFASEEKAEKAAPANKARKAAPANKGK